CNDLTQTWPDQRAELEQRVRQAHAWKIAIGDARERRERIGDARVLSAEHVAASGLTAVEDEHDATRDVVDVHEVETRVSERHERQSTARQVAHQAAEPGRVARPIHAAWFYDRDRQPSLRDA